MREEDRRKKARIHARHKRMKEEEIAAIRAQISELERQLQQQQMIHSTQQPQQFWRPPNPYGWAQQFGGGTMAPNPTPWMAVPIQQRMPIPPQQQQQIAFQQLAQLQEQLQKELDEIERDDSNRENGGNIA